MTPATIPTMPMGQAALQVSGGTPPLPSFPSSKMPAGAPPTAMPSPVAPMGAMPQMPAASAPAAPPYTVRLQPDGSSLYAIPSPDGDPMKDVVLGVNPAPKLPKAFQAPVQPQA